MLKYPPYRIETERCVIRCWDPKDASLLQDAVLSSIDHIKVYIPFALKEPITLEERIENIRSNRSKFDSSTDYVFGIFNREENRVLGSTGLHTRQGEYAFEIGYWIRKEESNKGIAKEVTEALIEVGYKVEKIDRIEIHCNPKNEYSRKIPESLNFELQGIRKRSMTGFPGEFRDTMVWVMYKDTYLKQNKIVRIRAYDVMGKEIDLGKI